MTQETFAVEELVSIRITNQGLKQVLIKWEGYPRRTWEPYSEIQTQLPEMIAAVEKKVLEKTKELQSSRKRAQERAPVPQTDEIINANHDQSISAFLSTYLANNPITHGHRWSPHEVNALEIAAINHEPPVKETTDELKKKIMQLLRDQQ